MAHELVLAASDDEDDGEEPIIEDVTDEDDGEEPIIEDVADEEDDSSLLRAGCHATLHGLSREELNGREAELRRWMPEKERWAVVTVADGLSFLVRESNLAVTEVSLTDAVNEDASSHIVRILLEQQPSGFEALRCTCRAWHDRCRASTRQCPFPVVVDAALRADGDAPSTRRILSAAMGKLRRNLDRIAAVLEALQYPRAAPLLLRPAETDWRGGPSHPRAKDGSLCRVPLVLELFWNEIGGVCLAGCDASGGPNGDHCAWWREHYPELVQAAVAEGRFSEYGGPGSDLPPTAHRVLGCSDPLWIFDASRTPCAMRDDGPSLELSPHALSKDCVPNQHPPYGVLLSQQAPGRGDPPHDPPLLSYAEAGAPLNSGEEPRPHRSFKAPAEQKGHADLCEQMLGELTRRFSMDELMGAVDQVLAGGLHTKFKDFGEAFGVQGWSLLAYLRMAVLECGGFPGYRGLAEFEPVRRRLVEGMEDF